MFDLHELHATGPKAWNSQTAFGNFTLNVCGPLANEFSDHNGCDVSGKVAACLHRNDTTLNIGEESMYLATV